MAWDFRLDYRSGDLVFGPDGDLLGVSGPELAWHRAHIRLMIQRGTWILDPTDGELGSQLPRLLRQGISVGEAEAELLVREALAPMEDVEVVDIQVRQNSVDPRKLDVHVKIRPIFSGQSIPSANIIENVLTFTVSR